MAKDSPYFQFPVKMLASESDTQSLVQNICSYSLWHYGVSLWEVSPEQVETLAKEYIDCHPSLTGPHRVLVFRFRYVVRFPKPPPLVAPRKDGDSLRPVLARFRLGGGNASKGGRA